MQPDLPDRRPPGPGVIELLGLEDDDVESFLPLAALRSLIGEGRIGSLTRRFHGVPTDYSQRRTIEQDAPEILARCREDAADIALLVPL